MVGVRGKGLGAFIKTPKKGKEIKAKTLFKVKQGNLIYNRLFAHRGSFAVLDTTYEGCFVSGEFPQFEAKKTKYNPDNLIQYLFYYCINPIFVDNVRRNSSGSTKQSRFRLNQTLFLNFKIKIPSEPEDLNRIVSKMDDLFTTASSIKEIQKVLDITMAEMKEKLVLSLPQF